MSQDNNVKEFCVVSKNIKTLIQKAERQKVEAHLEKGSSVHLADTQSHFYMPYAGQCMMI